MTRISARSSVGAFTEENVSTFTSALGGIEGAEQLRVLPGPSWDALQTGREVVRPLARAAHHIHSSQPRWRQGVLLRKTLLSTKVGLCALSPLTRWPCPPRSPCPVLQRRSPAFAASGRWLQGTGRCGERVEDAAVERLIEATEEAG